jgi:hypothetical protein
MAVVIQQRFRLYEIFISVFVAVLLLAQAATLGDRYFGTKFGGRKYWPIISYLMYDDPHFEGETIKAYYPLEGVLIDGQVVAIGQDDLGLDFWNYMHLGEALSQNKPEALKLLLHLYKKGHLTEVRVKTLPVMVTRQGPAYKASEIVRSLPIAPQAAK